MATSGNFLTSDSGQGGGVFYGRMIYEWGRNSWGRSGGLGYHNLWYRLKTYGGNSSYYQYFYQGYMNMDGTGHSQGGGSIQAYGAGATSIFGTKNKTVYTNSAGNKTISTSAHGGIYYNTINTSGSANFALDNIPMYGDITSITGGTWNDEGVPYSIDWFKYTGKAHIWLRFNAIDSGDSTYHYVNVSQDPLQWSGFQTWVQQSLVNTNSATLSIYYGDDLDGNGSVDRWDTPNTRTMQILNDSGQANPTFADFDYLDTNSTTSTITGDDQVLIQGKSTLEVTVASADAATTNKNANRGTYSFTIGGYSDSETWPASGDTVNTPGTISDVTGSQNLSVKAIDSRSNNTTVTKSVNIVPYSSPAFVPSLNVKYSNDYDNTSGITVTAEGTKIANTFPLTISSVDKNSVNGTSGVRFDMSKGINSSYRGCW